mmetsp:Transcript_86078/g.221659  ORF Transcript_86078/g.221659 Transcript_86078/m.221659 type:complete len:260 (-) Transcript_86078:68-847(-)
MVCSPVLGEVGLRDDVQDGHHKGVVLFVSCELLQQRLQPVALHDAVRLHEDEHGAGDQSSADDLGSNQALALRVAVHADSRVERPELRVELELRVVAVVHEQNLVQNLGRRERQHRGHRGRDVLPRLVQVRDDERRLGQRRQVKLLALALPGPDLRRRRERRQRRRAPVAKVGRLRRPGLGAFIHGDVAAKAEHVHGVRILRGAAHAAQGAHRLQARQVEVRLDFGTRLLDAAQGVPLEQHHERGRHEQRPGQHRQAPP